MIAFVAIKLYRLYLLLLDDTRDKKILRANIILDPIQKKLFKSFGNDYLKILMECYPLFCSL